MLSYYVLKWLNKTIDIKLYFDSYKKICKLVLERYGDLPIKRFYVVRRKIPYYFSLLLDLLTFKAFSKQLNNYKELINNDDFFPMHTHIMVEVELPNKFRKSIVIDKCNGIEVTTNFRKYESQDMMKIKLNKKDKLTINKLLNLTREKMGAEEFYNWNFYKNNCQQFIIKILESLNKNKEQYENFVLQKSFLQSINLPNSVLYFTNCLTNLASLVESIYYDFTL